MALTENILAAHPDLAGVFADNESSSSGAVQALKSRNARTVKMVAFDASEQLAADCRAGWIDSLVVQDPFRMGYESTLAVVRYRKGEHPPRRVDSGVRLIERAQLDHPEVRRFCSPTSASIWSTNRAVSERVRERLARVVTEPRPSGNGWSAPVARKIFHYNVCVRVSGLTDGETDSGPGCQTRTRRA